MDAPPASVGGALVRGDGVPAVLRVDADRVPDGRLPGFGCCEIFVQDAGQSERGQFKER